MHITPAGVRQVVAPWPAPQPLQLATAWERTAVHELLAQHEAAKLVALAVLTRPDPAGSGCPHHSAALGRA
ncbi:hypothetical protein [Dactylosporangium matsuzakiense]|uniref:hypothetical protein n=1 Tax=Dactylosporangium matsuzakiense TaxID=53360 RepID=UPI0021C3512E|nr:hypothetical protein [Dactylosporangium matsuzakiense]UWZ41357.1 hypothetical protein Dmats_27185 [Dactylosporangium matsuzakiense]